MEGKVGIALRTTIVPGDHSCRGRRSISILPDGTLGSGVDILTAQGIEVPIGKAAERMIFDEIRQK